MALKELTLVTPRQVSDAAAALRTSAQEIDAFGTPSQAGMTPEDQRVMADMLTKLSEEVEAQRLLRKELREAKRRANSAERDLKAAWKYRAPPRQSGSV